VCGCSSSSRSLLHATSAQVFGADSKQERVYKQAIVPIVQEVLDGFNCTIFAYGQTGTGKTYTMEGGPRNSVDGSNLSAEAGVIPRAIRQIFDALECNQVTDSSVKVSFMELYNEELTDLLSPGDDKDKRLRLLEDRSGVVVQGLEEVVVKNAAGVCVCVCVCVREREREQVL
jgi:kinesin family member 11